MKNIIYKYIVYIIYFLGTGLTSSGIVLMPFNHVRYSIILAIGLSLFVFGSMFNEVVIDRHKLSAKESIKLILISLLLAIGIGMISGGISHFKESPLYATYLIPLGIYISFTCFFLKNKFEMIKKEKIKMFIFLFIFIIILHIFLSILANTLFDTAVLGGDVFKMTH